MANSALSEVQAANLTANTTASNASTNLSNQFSSVGQMNSINTGGFIGIGSVSLAGMNVNNVGAMKQAVTRYVANVDAVLSKLQNLEANAAFGYKIGKVVQSYVASVKDACVALCGNLMAFCDDLDAIKETYIAKSESMTSSINNTSSGISDAASRYKYGAGTN